MGLDIGGFFKDWWKGDDDDVKDAVKAKPYHEQSMQPAPMIQGGIISRQQPMMAASNPYYDPNRLFRMPGTVPFGGYMKKGGKVDPDKAYIVGEDGPELIVPHDDATIIPNDQVRAQSNDIDSAFRPDIDTNQAELPQPIDATTGGVALSAPAPAGLAPVIDPAAVASAPPVGDTTTLPPAAAAAPATAEQPVTVPANYAEPAATPATTAAPPVDPNDPRARLFRRPSQDTWDQIEQTYTPGTTPQTDAPHRLGSGLAKGYRTWEPGQGSGGIFGLLAHTLFKGIGSAVSQNQYDDVSRDDKRQKLFREQLEPELGYEKADAALQNEQLQPYFKQQTSDLKREQFVNRIYRDQQGFAAKLDQIRAKAEAEGGKWKPYVDTVTGQVLKTFPNDPTRKPEALLDEDNTPIFDPLKKSYDYTDPLTGNVYPVTGGEALRTGSTAYAANMTATNTAGRVNTAAENKYQGDLADYNNKVSTLTAQAVQAINEAGAAEDQLGQLESSMKGLGYAPTAQQEQQRAQLQATIRNKRAQGQSLNDQARMLQAPPKPESFTPQTRPTGKYAGQTAPSVEALRPYFKGKTDEQIKTIWTSNGGRFN